MMNVGDVVFIHGWGLNKAVWQGYLTVFAKRFPELNVHNLDIPGYGDLAHTSSHADIVELAKNCLDQAPEQAMWVGWSLGGMITLQAAILAQNTNKIQGMQLINTTPKFVYSDDWISGVDIDIFKKFSADLARDYSKTLATFLLLQAGANRGARQLARDAQDAISVYGDPSEITLMQGIGCLESCDLRTQLAQVTLPSQVVCGTLDRVTKPESSQRLAQLLETELVEIQSGHAPFLTHPSQMLDCFAGLLQTVLNNAALGGR